MASVLGWGSMEIFEMPLGVEDYEGIRRTSVVLISLSKKRVGSIEFEIKSTTWSTHGLSSLVICVSLSNEIVGLTVLGIRSITPSSDDRLGESIQ